MCCAFLFQHLELVRNEGGGKRKKDKLSAALSDLLIKAKHADIKPASFGVLRPVHPPTCVKDAGLSDLLAEAHPASRLSLEFSLHRRLSSRAEEGGGKERQSTLAELELCRRHGSNVQGRRLRKMS